MAGGALRSRLPVEYIPEELPSASSRHRQRGVIRFSVSDERIPNSFMVQSEKGRADQATEGATGGLPEAWQAVAVCVDVRWATTLDARQFRRGCL